MRRRTRNRLVLAALPFALKGLMWWRVKLAVDDFVARIADQAEIRYQAIETDWDGATSVIDIRLRPRAFDRAITIERVELEMRLLGLVPEDLQDHRVARARLDGARLAFEIDPDFGQQLARHCAERLGLSGPEAYAEVSLAQTRAQLAAAGIEVGEALQRALADYHRHWGRIELELRPPEPLAPLQLAAIPPEQIVGRLGMSLVVNGRPVLPLEIHFRPRPRATTPSATVDAPESAAGRPHAGYRIQRRYRPTSVARLGDHLGEKVRIRPRGQPSREGVLIAVVNGEAQLEQRVPGGTVEAYVPLREIESVEVEEQIKVPWTPDSGVRSVPAK